MKYIKYIFAMIIVAVCLLCTAKFVLQNTKLNRDTKKQDISIKNTENKTKNSGDVFNEDIWSKIAKNYVFGMEGIVIHDFNETVLQDDWSYKIKDAYITKQRSPKWDSVPDWEMYQYDEKENLINEYSYLAVKIKITCNSKSKRGNMYLNSIGLHCYNDNGDSVFSSELMSASLGKKDSKDYFQCPLKENESIETELVYIISDEAIGEKYYYLVEINNSNVMTGDATGFSLVKLPLGIEKSKS